MMTTDIIQRNILSCLYALYTVGLTITSYIGYSARLQVTVS